MTQNRSERDAGLFRLRRTRLRLLAAVLWIGLLASPAFGQTAAEGGDPSTPPAGETTPPAEEDGLSFSLKTGLGYDGNVFRAHDLPYDDYGLAARPPVHPTVHSGMFTPLTLELGWGIPAGGDTTLRTGYRFDGTRYWRKALAEANEYSHEVRLGAEVEMARVKKRRDTLYAGVFAVNRRRQYVDRDSGREYTTTAQAPVGNRYTYTSTGVEAAYDLRTTPVRVGLWATLEQRDYKDPGAVSQYDHEFRKIGGDIDLPLGGPLRLKLDYEFRDRDYTERPSRNLLGNALTSNPPLNYRYNEAAATLRYAPAKSARFYLEYSRLTRHDQYVGYNDYVRNKVRLRARIHPEGPMLYRLGVSYWERTYPNAFAFDNDTQAAKYYEGREWQAKAEYEHSPELTYFGEARTWRIQSTDLRYEYNRYTVTTGAEWSW